MRHIYTSVDIGSDTIKIVVCELFNKKLNLLAASSIKSNINYTINLKKVKAFYKKK